MAPPTDSARPKRPLLTLPRVVLTITIAAAAGTWYGGRGPAPERYTAMAEDIASIQHDASRWAEEVRVIKDNPLSHFDTLATIEHAISNAVKKLKNDARSDTDTPAPLKRAINGYAAAIRAHRETVEQFKTRHQRVRISAQYLPQAAKAAATIAESANETALAALVRKTADTVDAWYETPTAQAETAITEMLALIEQMRIEAARADLDGALSELASHAKVLLKDHERTEETFSRASATPAVDRAKDLAQKLETETAIATGARKRTTSAASAIALAGGLGTFILMVSARKRAEREEALPSADAELDVEQPPIAEIPASDTVTDDDELDHDAAELVGASATMGTGEDETEREPASAPEPLTSTARPEDAESAEAIVVLASPLSARMREAVSAPGEPDAAIHAPPAQPAPRVATHARVKIEPETREVDATTADAMREAVALRLRTTLAGQALDRIGAHLQRAAVDDKTRIAQVPSEIAGFYDDTDGTESAEGALGESEREALLRHAQQTRSLGRRLERALTEMERRRGPERVSLANAIETALEATGARARAHLNTDINPDAQVLGARAEIEQACVELTRNGLEALQPRESTGARLDIAIVSDTESHTIVWTDNGIGIEAERIKRAQSAFHTTKRDHMGLGLVLARDIAKRHGGAFRLSSVEGQGTRATLTLPSA